jgi:hypothetical protein
VLTLVPIAIAYHLAHYPVVSMMAGRTDSAAVRSVRFWLGPVRHDPLLCQDRHRRALYLCTSNRYRGGAYRGDYTHTMALRVFKEKRIALKSQYPMLMLMIGYTMVSLWIAQPIVMSRFG